MDLIFQANKVIFKKKNILGIGAQQLKYMLLLQRTVPSVHIRAAHNCS